MKKIVYTIITISLFMAGRLLLQRDYTSFLLWWGTILCLGIIFMPLTALIMNTFHDKGYVFSKSLGIAITGYLMWLLSSLHILKFTKLSCYICILIGIILNGMIIIIQNRKAEINKGRKHFIINKITLKAGSFDSIAIMEIVFFAIFLIFTYIRGFKPEAYGTEKFMDYGFMTSMMRSEYMPPQDFWFSGTKLNYYYVGQFLATFLTKSATVNSAVGYNLMLTMIGALAFVLTFSLIYNLMLNYMNEKHRKGKYIPTLSGMVAGAAVCFAGNMHYPTYRWFEPLTRNFYGMEASTDTYWFPDSTRFIGYHPETSDKTIHEFPAYSFILGDLHAHVINIIFVLTILGVLFSWQCIHKFNLDKNKRLKDIINPHILIIAFLIGLFHTTNYWDFPIYYVVAGAVILFTNIRLYNYKVKSIAIITLLQGAVILLASFVFSMPFHMNFDTMASQICLTVARTPLNQLIILWGLPIFIVISFFVFKLSDCSVARKEIQDGNLIKTDPLFRNLLNTITISDLFILTIGLCALGLIIMPEIIYVHDIYNGDYKRANTMFKLTYQSFIMFGLSMGYIFIRLGRFGRTKRQKRVAIIGLVLFGLSLCYIQNAVNSWYGNIFNYAEYKGLDATAFMETTMPDDQLAIDWLNSNITSGMPVVLEAPGKPSYTDYERVSVMTGLPTVLGWYDHEWLWKSDTSILDKREADIKEIYTNTDMATVKQYLKKYNVSYIYVGKLEQEKYPSINHDLLKSIGAIVFMSPTDDIKSYETYIVKIAN